MTYVQNNGRTTTAATENPMTAPDKIWAWQYSDKDGKPDTLGEWYTKEVGLDGDETEYTRTDTIPAMIAEAEARGREKGLRDAAEIAFEADDCYLARNAILALIDTP